LEPLHFPAYDFRTRRGETGFQIWDQGRRKWVALTPEEWVRQHAARFLTTELGYPSGRMAVEYTIQVHGLSRRADIVVFNQSGMPHVIVECKAPEVPVTQRTADQVARYNLELSVPHLMLTNGITHFFASHDAGSGGWKWLNEIPHYTEL